MSEILQEILYSFLEKTIPHVILSLTQIKSLDEPAAKMIISVQNQFYEKNCSFVICEVADNIKPLFEESMNVTPTESEAWDILQMEEIERELMKDFD
jgi:anti-anti-sigma regulatory factor